MTRPFSRQPDLRKLGCLQAMSQPNKRPKKKPFFFIKQSTIYQNICYIGPRYFQVTPESLNLLLPKLPKLLAQVSTIPFHHTCSYMHHKEEQAMAEQGHACSLSSKLGNVIQFEKGLCTSGPRCQLPRLCIYIFSRTILNNCYTVLAFNPWFIQ